MKRNIFAILVLVGATTGVVCGHLIYCVPALRDLIGSPCGRGHLLALVEGHGIHEADLRRALAELRYARSAEDQDRHEDNIEKRLVLTRLILDTSVRSVAAHEKVRKAKIDSELKSLRWQFPTEKTWSTALAASDLSIGSLRRSERGSGLPADSFANQRNGGSGPSSTL